MSYLELSEGTMAAVNIPTGKFGYSSVDDGYRMPGQDESSVWHSYLVTGLSCNVSSSLVI